MELTRRDAAAALAAIGATGGVALGADRIRDSGDGASAPKKETDPITDEEVRAALVAIARVVYPEAVSGVEAFVNGFLDGRLTDDPHARALRETVTEIDGIARSWHDAPIAALSAETRDRLLRELGADTAEEDPDGTTAERVRYYVVNELLLALYTSPTGGELAGIENPQGYPGGAESYARGPR